MQNTVVAVAVAVAVAVVVVVAVAVAVVVVVAVVVTVHGFSKKSVRHANKSKRTTVTMTHDCDQLLLLNC